MVILRIFILRIGDWPGITRAQVRKQFGRGLGEARKEKAAKSQEPGARQGYPRGGPGGAPGGLRGAPGGQKGAGPRNPVFGNPPGGAPGGPEIPVFGGPGGPDFEAPAMKRHLKVTKMTQKTRLLGPAPGGISGPRGGPGGGGRRRRAPGAPAGPPGRGWGGPPGGPWGGLGIWPPGNS